MKHHDDDHIHIKTRAELKDELINVQREQYKWLSITAGGFAAELIAEQWMHPRNQWRGPVIFASSIVALAGIVGDIYHGAHRHRVERELKSTTSLHQL